MTRRKNTILSASWVDLYNR